MRSNWRGKHVKLYLREYAGEEERPPCREEWRRQEWTGTRSRLPQVDRSPSRRSPYLARDDEPSPAPDERGRSASAGAHHRARPRPLRYQSLERDYDRSYAPPPPPEDDYYRREPPLFLGELQSQNSDLQRELGNLKKELELTNQKLGSSMHSIKTFWSPELKKERALRKEESAKYSLINDQLKLLNQENQVSYPFYWFSVSVFLLWNMALKSIFIHFLWYFKATFCQEFSFCQVLDDKDVHFILMTIEINT